MSNISANVELKNYLLIITLWKTIFDLNPQITIKNVFNFKRNCFLLNIPQIFTFCDLT